MTFKAFDHIVLLVASLEHGISTWQDKLGLTLDYRIEQPTAGIAQAFFTLADGTFIELIAPTSQDSDLAALLETREEGLHVLAMQVDDLEQAQSALEANDVRLIGVGTERVFIHPQSANGILVQLWPADKPHRWRDAL